MADQEADGCWYDERAADAAVAFFGQHLRLTEGEWAGRPFVLEPWQADRIIRPLFGRKRADGTRRYRRCIVWVPRKNGKTELAAGVALLALIGDGELGGQGYAIARDEDQARIVFGKAQRMVAWSATLSKHLETFKTSIFCPALQAAFKPLSGTPEGKHGLGMSFLVGDEAHEWPDGRLYTFVHQSSAHRRQPLEFIISTAGEQRGYGWELWKHCEAVRAGEVDDPATLIVVYAADAADDWTAEATWRKANPNAGVSVKLDYLAEECAKARTSPRLENDFRRYHLNQWTEQAVRWLPMAAWDASNPGGADRWRQLEQQLVGRRCTGGLDLSSTTDLTSLVWLFEPQADGEPWHALVRSWLPEARLEEATRRDRQPYDLWRQAGALKTTPGNVIDYDVVRAQIAADAERFDIATIGVDPYNATQLTLQLQAEGHDAKFFRQGYLSMSAPSKELERLVLEHRLDHGGQPVLRMAAANAVITTDPAGNIKPAKDKANGRIDPLVALINALGVAISAKQVGPSVYETRGVVIA